MRPTKLVMSAFGPYASKTIINMDELGTSGLYLITGDTGAGKTTIFDAITYALYGEASGDNRDSSMFRSKYADPSTPTEVELTFVYAGKQYYIKRSPEYEREKSRGDGMVTVASNAELHTENRVITKTREVNNAIVQIMGIDRNQFTQIAMIAQGEFLKLLLAPTEERKKIFQKLFHTKKYYLLQEELKSKASELSKEYDRENDSVRQYINGILCDEDDALSIQVSKAKNDELTMEDKVELLRKIISQDNELGEKLNNENAENEAKIQKIQELQAKVQEYEKWEKSLIIYKEQLSNLLERFMVIDKEKTESEALKSQIDELAKTINRIELEMPEYDEADEKEKRLVVIDNLITASDAKEAEIQERISAIAEEISKMEAEYRKLSVSAIDCSKKEAELKNAKQCLESIEKILLDIIEAEELEKKLETAQKVYLEKATASKALKSDYESKNTAYLNEQAGILASTLSEGEPCPVCGSHSHPRPAIKSLSAPTREELEKAKALAERAGNEETTASEKAATIKAQLKERKAEILGNSKKYVSVSEYINAAELLKARAEILNSDKLSIEEELNAIKTNLNKASQLEKNIPEKKNSLEKSRESENDNLKNRAALQAEKILICKRLSELRDKLNFKNKETADKAYKDQLSKKEKLELDIKETEEKYKKCLQEKISLENTIHNTEEILKDKIDIDIEAEKGKLDQLTQKKDKLAQMIKITYARNETNKNILTKVSEKAERISALETELRWVRSLSNTANGNVSGKEKIMLETYVQRAYFDRIIDRANLRLSVMSEGQYELVRKKEADNFRSQTGLELDIRDYYNDTYRSVRTLSGGESFLASLSLALGLSDEIQSSAGGIKLDTMFVDEGFGSLDGDTLTQAMKALTSIADGNRLVGIISHVDDMKNKIDKQIIVRKGKSGGSTAEIRA